MMAFVRQVKAPLILERAKQQGEQDGVFLIPALAGGLDYCASPKLLPTCIFYNFIKLLAARSGDVVRRLRRSRLRLPNPAAASLSARGASFVSFRRRRYDKGYQRAESSHS